MSGNPDLLLKNHHFLLKNHHFLLKNPHFLLKNHRFLRYCTTERKAGASARLSVSQHLILGLFLRRSCAERPLGCLPWRFSEFEPAINRYKEGGDFPSHVDGHALTLNMNSAILLNSAGSFSFSGGGTAFWCDSPDWQVARCDFLT